MKYLYNENDFNILQKKKSYFYWLFVLDFVLEVIIVLLCLFLSNYHSKLLFSIIGSALSIFVIFFLIYLIDYFGKINHLIKEYFALLNSKDVIIEGVVINASDTLTTLSDGTKAYKITVKSDENSYVILLSDIFDMNIAENQKYKFATYYNYIKGFEVRK